MAASPLSEHDAVINDVSRRMAFSQLSRRQSRSSNTSSNRRSARIEKPRSHHNSPMVLERRRTTTSVKKFTSLDDHWEMMFGSGNVQTRQGEDTSSPRRPHARPMSWHPASGQAPGFASQTSATYPPPTGYSNYLQADYPQSYSTFYTTPSSDVAFPELGYMGNLTPSDAYSYSMSPSWNGDSSSLANAFPPLPPYPSLSSDPSPGSISAWQQNENKQPPTSHPSSVDFLPIQHPTQKDDEVLDDDDDSEALVGLGLYDPPPGLSGLTSGFQQSTGKGLKLEESWQPPEQQDDDEDNDASSDDESVEEVPSTNAEVEEQKWSINSARQVPTNLSGQTFFFEDDETYTNEWWFHQLKQPTAQGTDLGYGWI